MKLLIACDAVFAKQEDGWYCNIIDYNLIIQFKDYFENIEVIGRRGNAKKDFVKVDIEKVEVSSVKSVTSPKGLLKIGKIYKHIKKAALDSDAVYCRGYNGMIARGISTKNKKPNVTYLGGCPYTSMKTMGNLGYWLFAPFAFVMYKNSVRKSDNVIYCSPYLKKDYPCSNNTFCWTAAKIKPYADELLTERKNRIYNSKNLVIGLVGQIRNNIKGIDTAIKAMSKLDNSYKLKILGSGDPAPWKEFATRYGVSDRVEFCGVLKGGDKVLNWLDDIDIYIQPSLTEGLPKASIEAISRGCPLISTGVAGLADITHKEYIHSVGNYKKLAQLIQSLGDNRDKLKKMSEYSLSVAENYKSEILDETFEKICTSLLEGEK